MELACHCGNIHLYTSQKPNQITECNCSVCRRYGALWAYYAPQEVQISEDIASRFYIWGDKEVEFHFCPVCGCITHYITTPKCDIRRVALNMRMADPALLTGIAVRKFDGASQ